MYDILAYFSFISGVLSAIKHLNMWGRPKKFAWQWSGFIRLFLFGCMISSSYFFFVNLPVFFSLNLRLDLFGVYFILFYKEKWGCV